MVIMNEYVKSALSFDQIRMYRMISDHLRYNHVPSIPQDYVHPVLHIINGLNKGTIEAEEFVTLLNGKKCYVYGLIELMHLESFIESTETVTIQTEGQIKV